jgi:TonB family protein
MKTCVKIEDREAETTSFEAPAFLSLLEGREAKRALSLSIIPGLGQIYNGEAIKGLLFLGVNAANLLLLSLLFFTEPLLKALLYFATTYCHAAPKLNVHQAVEIVQTGGAVIYLYLGLIFIYAIYAGRDAFDRACEKRQGMQLPRFVLSMPEATSGSYLLHFSIITSLILLVILFAAPPKPQAQVTDILLLQTPEPPAKKVEPPKPKEEPKPEPKQELIKPEKKVEQPKLTPVAFAVPSDKPVADPVVQSSEPAPAPTPPPQTGATGSATGSSAQEAGGGDSDEVDFSSYVGEMQKRIKKNWYPPRGAESLTVTLKFKVLKDGSLGSVRLVRSTGISAADDAAKAAITNSAPFPPLPKGAGDDIDIKFTFDYNVFNGKLPAGSQ